MGYKERTSEKQVWIDEKIDTKMLRTAPELSDYRNISGYISTHCKTQ